MIQRLPFQVEAVLSSPAIVELFDAVHYAESVSVVISYGTGRRHG